MDTSTADLWGLAIALIAILLTIGWSLGLHKLSVRTRAFLKILVALIVIGYTWVPFDGERIYYSILITVFALYVINNEYRSVRRSS